jgi:hypothetical protein
MALLTQYFKANPMLESKSNSKDSKCYCSTYSYGSYTYYYCGNCCYCATGDKTCCANINYQVTGCSDGEPLTPGLPVYCGCCNTSSCGSAVCTNSSCASP